jgi:glycosyltransferase involved in cell wall biosynthesis
MTKIAMLTGSVSRQGGGVFEAIVGLSRGLQALPSVEVHVVGLRDAMTDADAASWGDIPVTAGEVIGPEAFGYSSAYAEALSRIRPDIVHVHGLWMYATAAALRWTMRTGTACLASPHGMLDRWALGHASVKKRVARLLYQDRYFRHAGCLHAVGQSEFEAIRMFGLPNPVCVIANGVAPAGAAAHGPAWRETLLPSAKILLYLGRLHPKKNLPAFLRAWAACRDVWADWHLVIAGWDDGGHRAELEALVAELSLDGNVHLVGPQFGREKTATFAAADAFVLPSLSEGLPVAVLEAWSHRLPVLMTPQCNLPEGFEAGAAVRLGPQAEEMAVQLRAWFGTGRDALVAMGDAGLRLVKQRYDWSSLAAEMASVYRWMLGDKTRPRSLSFGNEMTAVAPRRTRVAEDVGV